MASGDYRTGDHDYWTGYMDDFKVYNDTIKPEIYYRPADSWTQVSSFYIKDNGAWKQADSIVFKQDNWKISG